MLARIGSIAAALVLSACASIARSDQPAVLTNPGEESHAELVTTISAALNVQAVRIAEDAFTRESLLVIERTPARDPSGQRLSGRDLDRPEQFQLRRTGEHCVLLHVRTGERYELTRSRCRGV